MSRATFALLICIVCCHQAFCENLEEATGGRRDLLQTYGYAFNSYIPGTSSGGSNSLKRSPTGDQCYIANSVTAKVDCSVIGVGTTLQQVPACCSSTSKTSSTTCASYDDAKGFSCTASARPYPACCEYRNQPAASCKAGIVVPSGVRTCSANLPAFGCCDGNKDPSCAVDKDSITTTILDPCKAGDLQACCPA